MFCFWGCTAHRCHKADIGVRWGKTLRNRYSTSFGRHIRKRPNVGTLASSIVGNEFEVLPFPKFAPNKFDGKFRKGEVFGRCGIGHSATFTACQWRLGAVRYPHGVPKKCETTPSVLFTLGVDFRCSIVCAFVKKRTSMLPQPQRQPQR